MSNIELRSVHPVETKEVADVGARWITRVVIGAAGILSYAPFVIYFAQH